MFFVIDVNSLFVFLPQFHEIDSSTEYKDNFMLKRYQLGSSVRRKISAKLLGPSPPLGLQIFCRSSLRSVNNIKSKMVSF